MGIRHELLRVPLVLFVLFLIVTVIWVQSKGSNGMQTNNSQNKIPPWFSEEKVVGKEQIVGKWSRVDTVKGQNGWRVFLADGKLLVCYGDMIYEGSFRFLGNRTIETTYHIFGQKDEIHQWTSGIHEGQLVLVNLKTGWVEIYYHSRLQNKKEKPDRWMSRICLCTSTGSWGNHLASSRSSCSLWRFIGLAPNSAFHCRNISPTRACSSRRVSG